MSPQRATLESASRRVARAAQRSLEAAWSVPAFHSEIRRNPAACDCPQWEVALAGRWTRVSLRPASAATPEVIALLVPATPAGPAGGEVSTVEAAPTAGVSAPEVAELQFTREVVTSETGWRYPVVSVLTLGGPEAAAQPDP